MIIVLGKRKLGVVVDMWKIAPMNSNIDIARKFIQDKEKLPEYEFVSRISRKPYGEKNIQLEATALTNIFEDQTENTTGKTFQDELNYSNTTGATTIKGI